MGRTPTAPRCALLVDFNGTIQAVSLPYVAEKVGMGWFLVASDDDVMSEPMPPPAMDMRLLSDGQSNPVRDHGYGVARDNDETEER